MNKQDGIHSQGPMPPTEFSVKEEKKEEKEEEEEVSLLTQVTTRGVGKNTE